MASIEYFQEGVKKARQVVGKRQPLDRIRQELWLRADYHRGKADHLSETLEPPGNRWGWHNYHYHRGRGDGLDEALKLLRGGKPCDSLDLFQNAYHQ